MAILRISYDGVFVSDDPQHGGGRLLTPPPVVSMATVIRNQADIDGIQASQDFMRCSLVFREDSFAPVPRVRRGRLYRNQGDAQPAQLDTTISPVGEQGRMSLARTGMAGPLATCSSAWCKPTA